MYSYFISIGVWPVSKEKSKYFRAQLKYLMLSGDKFQILENTVKINIIINSIQLAQPSNKVIGCHRFCCCCSMILFLPADGHTEDIKWIFKNC